MIKILDLYCGAGGCSWGYHQALNNLGIDHVIVGVDINPQPDYPFQFIHSDAIAYLESVGETLLPGYDFYHASPPCQAHSRCKSLHKELLYPDFIVATRNSLTMLNVPYVIENVPGSPLHGPIILDGTMFGLQVIRKRLFEISSGLHLGPAPQRNKQGTVGGKNFTRKNPGQYFIVGGHQSGTIQEWRDAMGIQWMTKKELAQAIPPAYTNWIGNSIFPQLFKK